MINHLVPTEFYLGQNYPNPFKDKTVIKYCVAYKTRVQITVYDAEGKEIEKLVDEEKEPGTHQVEFSICHSRESTVGGGNLPAVRHDLPDGYCYYKMTAGDYISEKKWLCINNLLRSNTMKTLLRTLFFFLMVTQTCFGQWVQIGFGNKSVMEIAVHNSNIYAITSDNALYRSSNNGINWLQIIDTGVTDIAVTPNGLLFMIREYLNQMFEDPYDSLYRSSDSGDTWVNLNIMAQVPPPPLPDYAHPINITVSPAGFLFCGIKQKIWHIKTFTYLALSTDNGNSWTSPGDQIHGGDLFEFRGQCVITFGHMLGNSVHSDVYFSSDNGLNWFFLGDPILLTCNALSMCWNGNILIGGSDGLDGPGIFLSINSCSSWTKVSSIIPETGLTIESGGVLVGTENLGVFMFSDNGDSLGSFNEGLTNLNVRALIRDNDNYVYACTDNGLWLRPLTEIVTSIEEEPTQPSEFSLSQNYPNPFNNSCAIKYSIPKSSQVSVKIFNTLGEEIVTLINEEKPAGIYELNWNAVNLPSGVYFYRIQAGSFVQTRKMILLK